MNKNNILPAVGIAALVLCVALSAGKTQNNKTSEVSVTPGLPPIVSETQHMSLDEIERRFRKTFDETSPGSYRYSTDIDAQTITVDQWSPGYNTNVVNSALSDLEYYRKWEATVSSVSALGVQMQELVSQHGHPDYTVIIRVMNCDDTDQVFVTIEGGNLVYDIVDATPAGQRVEAPTDRAVFAWDGRYVVNTYSKKFHLPGCEYEQKIAPENRALFTGDRADLIADGYDPCDWCRP